MAPRTPKRRTIQHFTHIHPLTEFNSAGDFICDGCKTYGSGKTYRCEPCNYDLHDYCATCPLTLPTFIHPQHELSLVVRKQQSTRQNERACDICNESVEGLFYRCKLCEFDVHPLCTQLPQHVRHVLHPAHHLEFRLGGASPCMVCYNPCQSWRYRCELCRFDIHMECILAVCNTSPPDKTEASGTKSRGLKPEGGQPSWSAPWQQPHVGYPYGFAPMGQQPQFGYPYNAFGPMGQQPYHPHSFNNFSYMNGFNANPGQVPAAGSGEKPSPSKGWKMFTIASKLTVGVVSNALFGLSIESLFA
ncbi:Cysteine/Histidine-rich C1 domain family protein [Raphanus sativus]|uniref:Protein VACUOLELESS GAMETOPHYTES n=1 Tax=Raphanus sativus TaxID=3726 RepID=A0A6J0JQZ1_RAPSA|nr:protein VACUOLELESS GAMETOPHYTES [Raphanus sativus]KAJ4891864.1 Cysteine/Histidine-rich C1 domain family protein [Raphanus sativus]